jgi:hypothetical protein
MARAGPPPRRLPLAALGAFVTVLQPSSSMGRPQTLVAHERPLVASRPCRRQSHPRRPHLDQLRCFPRRRVTGSRIWTWASLLYHFPPSWSALAVLSPWVLPPPSLQLPLPSSLHEPCHRPLSFREWPVASSLRSLSRGQRCRWGGRHRMGCASETVRLARFRRGRPAGAAA